MNSIITTNLKDITLSSQFLTLTTPNGEVEIDIKKLLQEPVNSDNAYFNATQIAKLYGRPLNEYFKSNSTREYYEKRESILNTVNLRYLKMKKTVRGKHHSGTWLHAKAILHFLRWVNVDLEIAMDDFIQNLILHSNEIKIERSSTKILFKDLTKVIKDIYIPAQESDNAKKFAYSILSGLVNIKVLGVIGTKYAKDNNIEVGKGKSIRDYLSKEQLDTIKEVERRLSGLIEFGSITDYQILKDSL